MAEYSAVRVETGVDWLSMSLPIDKYPAAEWHNECLNIMEKLQNEGNEATNRTLLGYAGISIGNSFVGAGERGYYCQLSGNNAQRWWRDVWRAEGHISRLDIQCTAFINQSSARIGVDTFAAANRAAISKAGKRLWSVTQITGNDDGHSIYIGSKNSEQYANIYNKEVESGKQEYKGAWRYEIRFKNEHATKMAYELFTHLSQEQLTILATTKEWLARKGISVPWSADASQSLLCTISRGKTDKETALWWLEKQVKPALDKAKKLGYYREALAALGVLEQTFEIVSRETGEILEIA